MFNRLREREVVERSERLNEFDDVLVSDGYLVVLLFGGGES